MCGIVPLARTLWPPLTCWHSLCRLGTLRMRPPRDRNRCRTLASGLFALAAACASSRSEQREAPPVEAAAIPVAESTPVPPAVQERPPARSPGEAAPPDPVAQMLSAARAEVGNRGGREGV